MERVKEMMMWVVAMINCGLVSLKQKMYGTLTAKRAGLEGFVVVLIICIIAIAVAIVFRDAIINWFNTIMQSFTNKTNTLF